MGNRHYIAEAIKAEMGQDTVVKHALAAPFTVVSETDGKTGQRECLPMYFNCPGFVSQSIMPGSLTKTAKLAAAIDAPSAQAMSA